MKRLSPSTIYVLKSFLPYTEANLRLSFSPTKFFSELEKKDSIKAPAARNAYYRAIKKGLLVIDERGIPRLQIRASFRSHPTPLKSSEQAQK